eukprot:6021585-Pleurochrysis_carterae.AAC.1
MVRTAGRLMASCSAPKRNVAAVAWWGVVALRRATLSSLIEAAGTRAKQRWGEDLQRACEMHRRCASVRLFELRQY